MRTLLRYAAVAVLLALTAPATAGITGGYAGLGYGQSYYDLAPPGAVSVDDRDSAWKLFGGINFSQYFAVEFGYADLGRSSSSFSNNSASTRVDSQALYALAVGRLGIGERFAVLFKGGPAWWDVEASASAVDSGGTPVSRSKSDNGLNGMLGIGFEFSATKRFGVRIEWERFFGVGFQAEFVNPATGDFTSVSRDIDFASVGLTYSF
ncbi:MAG: outer membrane beta-barrel protein [Pseudomonadota bacterium]|nr:MAG: outer membrane beta-barrel protein [Pseudomonadota bacterium]